MSDTIGTYYFQLAPSTEGIGNSISEALGDAGTQSSKSFGSSFTNGLATFGKVTAGAVLAAGAGITKLASEAVNAYAEFEQLEGGIETLFGTGGKTLEEYAKSVNKFAGEETLKEWLALQQVSDSVLSNAQNAYKTAGLSANEYMDVAIQSSAAMINALGGDTKKAADLVDLSITDMADNVNKMGTSMEAVQNAYRGFSRGNFTMLDNLALGFAGTKEGMQELLNKAQELSGVKYDIESYADIVEAIHVVQTDMGITGTTAKEASDTITGSLASLKASWTNVITGIADENADFEGQIDSFVDSASTFADNLLPRVETAIGGVTKLVSKLAPKIISTLPDLFEKLAPEFLSAILLLISSVIQQLPSIVDSLLKVVTMALNALNEQLPSLIPIVISGVLQIVSSILGYLPQILEGLLTLVTSIVDSLLNEGLPILLAALPEIISAVVFFIGDAVSQIISAVALILQSIAEALPVLINTLIPVIPELVLSIIEALIDCGPQLGLAFIELLSVLFTILPQIIGMIWKEIPKVGMEIINVFKSKIPELIKTGQEGAFEFLGGFSSSQVFARIGKVFTNIWNGFKENFEIIKENTMNWGKMIIQGMIDGLVSMTSSVVSTVTSIASNISDGFKSFFGISSPSKLFAEYGGYIDEGLAQGVSDNVGTVEDAVGGLNNAVVDSMAVNAYGTRQLSSAGDNGIYGLLSEYLPFLAQGNNVNVSLEGNMGALFNMVKRSNDEYRKQTGTSAFA